LKLDYKGEEYSVCGHWHCKNKYLLLFIYKKSKMQGLSPTKASIKGKKINKIK
jgi:hypothetical protein